MLQTLTFCPGLCCHSRNKWLLLTYDGYYDLMQVSYPGWTKGCALVGLTVGLFSVGWAFLGRPELAGDLADRCVV
eukprot:1160749-Pelagomonas_calceolata.AAC.4